MEEATAFVAAQGAETVEDRRDQLAGVLTDRDTHASLQEDGIHVTFRKTNVVRVLKVTAVQMLQPHNSNPGHRQSSTVYKSESPSNPGQS